MGTLIKILIKLIESKLIKTGIEQAILKNQNYITIAKQIWCQIDEDYRITEKVEDKLESKAEQFDKLLLSKFPELTQDDITSIRQSIAGDINKGKAEVLSNSALLQQLQSSNVELTNNNTQLQANVQNLTQQNNNLQSNFDLLTQDKNNLINQNSQLQQTINDLQNKLSAIQTAVGGNVQTQSVVDNSAQSTQPQ